MMRLQSAPWVRERTETPKAVCASRCFVTIQPITKGRERGFTVVRTEVRARDAYIALVAGNGGFAYPRRWHGRCKA